MQRLADDVEGIDQDHGLVEVSAAVRPQAPGHTHVAMPVHRDQRPFRVADAVARVFRERPDPVDFPVFLPAPVFEVFGVA